MRSILQKRFLSSLRRSEKGTTAVEMALIAPVFFLMFMGIIEVSLIMVGQHLMENATFNASRTGKTGFVTEGSTQLETVRAVLNAELQALEPMMDLSKVSFTTTSYGTLSQLAEEGEGTSGLGGASEVVVYTVSYPWHLFTPMLANLMGNAEGNMVLTSRLVVRNEPF